MGKTSVVDTNEFARFVLTGVIATVGNISVVYLARFFVSFAVALLAGIVTGVALSFTLSKMFAFGSRSWKRAGVEVARFLIVYAVSCAVYWAVAIACEQFFLTRGLYVEAAELGGVLIGAATMTLVSYFGHRFFTYRTHKRVDKSFGTRS